MWRKIGVARMTEREKLIELMSTAGWNIFSDAQAKEQLADYLLANGVVVLPVDIIGNTLWFINCDDDIVCDKIYRIIISDRHDVYIFLQNSDDESYELSDIGKFLFYTREEAEKLLQKGIVSNEETNIKEKA